MNAETLRAWWFDRQGLMNPDAKLSSSEVLARTGWARSVGGVGPYLTLFSRAGISREQADQDVRDQEIHELPCARGCTYVVPRQDYALALKVGQGFSDETPIAQAKKYLGLTEEELERLSQSIFAALRGGPLDPKELRDAAGDAVRNLGPEGKKRGLTTTLPLALGRLQSHGHIRRVPTTGRLDQQRYRYALWNPNPMEGSPLTRPEAYTELARRFFQWIAPASRAHFQWFSGLGVKAAKDAVAPLGLVPLEDGSELLLSPADRDALLSYRPPHEPRYALVSGADGIALLRRDAGALIAAEDRERALLQEGGLQDLAAHAILDRGRLIGLWEYDPEAAEIVWTSFVPVNEDLKSAVARTETYIREQLGDARSFSLDSPESRRPRIEALRGLRT